MKKIPDINIGNKIIGPTHPVFIIAEAGVNHNGDPAKAIKLINAAKEAKADAVKFQTFSPDKLLLRNAGKPGYQIKNTDPDVSQYSMLKSLALGKSAHREICRHAASAGIIFMSTPYDTESVDLLESLGVAAYKLSSIEIINHPFIKYVAKKKKPLIMSTGLSDLKEISSAVRIVNDAGNRHNLVLLQCHFNYPTAYNEVNLMAMNTLTKHFNTHAGYSDHTMGTLAPIVAAALGARVIEKHITLDRNMRGPDHASSLEPAEFGKMVRMVRDTEEILGSARKLPTDSELSNMVARKSVVSVKDIRKGEKIRAVSLCAKRPGSGIWPTQANLSKIVGRTAKSRIAKDTIVQWEMVL